MLQLISVIIAALSLGFGLGYDYGYGEKWGQCEQSPGGDKLISATRNIDGSTSCTYANGYGRATYQTKRPRK